MPMTYFIKTFGCSTNLADSERVARVLENEAPSTLRSGYLLPTLRRERNPSEAKDSSLSSPSLRSEYFAKGDKKMTPDKNIYRADCVVINTCMIRKSAENRIYGLLNNLRINREKTGKPKTIILTGCLVGMAVRDLSGKLLSKLKEKYPMVDNFLPIAEVGFENIPLRANKEIAIVPISSGCNNFCAYCVVPYTRGREVSRPYKEIIEECQKLRKNKYRQVLLVGQNVNSYGADIVKNSKEISIGGKIVLPILVSHLGKSRIPTLFPYLLEEVAKMGFSKVDFISSNPWDFSDELIDVIARNENITRDIHLPVQSGNNAILKKMNRWYTRKEYLILIENLKFKIENLRLSTDIIVGFPGETKKQFEDTVDLCKKAGFFKAYISEYSDRPMTAAHKIFPDNVPHLEKKRRWQVLEDLINKPNIKSW